MPKRDISRRLDVRIQRCLVSVLNETLAAIAGFKGSGRCSLARQTLATIREYSARHGLSGSAAGSGASCCGRSATPSIYEKCAIRSIGVIWQRLEVHVTPDVRES